MGRVTGAAVAALLLIGFAAPAGGQTPPPKLAYINSTVILQNTPGRAQAESTFQRELAGMQQQVNVLQGQFDSAVSEFNRTSLVLSPSAKQQRQTELSQMQQRTQQQVQSLRDSASVREQQLMAPIMQRVQAVIEGLRAEGNYAMIFDAAAQGGSLIAADRSLDLSPLVIQRLQAAVQPAPTPPLAQPSDSTPAAAPPAAQPSSARPTRPRPPRP